MNQSAAKYLNLPFKEATAFFRQKVNLPTEAWDDLMGGMHSRAFVVAGATKSDLVKDLRTAVDKAISSGTTLAEFRKDFDKTVQKHGWNYKGSRGWRTGVIYNTNVAVAYASGHYKQRNSPAVLAARPYLLYEPSTSVKQRKDHQQWYGLLLKHDNPFWDAHTPPNGWGCKCGVRTASKRDIDRYTEKYKDSAHPVRTTAPAEGTYDFIDKKTGEVRQVPIGLDPGWDYNPGKAAWGERLSKGVMDEWRAKGKDAWERLTPGNWETFGRPRDLPSLNASAKVGSRYTSNEAAVEGLEEILDGPEKVFNFKGEDGFSNDILVNAASLIDHIDLNRTPWLPMLPEVLTDPQEVWLSFERHKGTGKVFLRQRIVRMMEGEGREKGMLVVVQAVNGMLEAWTIFPTSKGNYIRKQRKGMLIYAKD